MDDFKRSETSSSWVLIRLTSDFSEVIHWFRHKNTQKGIKNTSIAPTPPPDLFLGQQLTGVSPPGDPGFQRLVLNKLCQPPNDLQQRAVSLLILGIPLPHHLPDPPTPHPHPLPLHPSIASCPALCPSSPCERLLSPGLETAYQGPHVIRLRDLTDRSTSEITSYYQRRGWRCVCVSSLSGRSFLSPQPWLGTEPALGSWKTDGTLYLSADWLQGLPGQNATQLSTVVVTVDTERREKPHTFAVKPFSCPPKGFLTSRPLSTCRCCVPKLRDLHFWLLTGPEVSVSSGNEDNEYS